MSALRTRLIVALLAASFAALGGAGVATYLQAKREIDALFDYQLRQLALSLREQGFVLTPPAATAAADPSFDYVIQVWDRSGVRVYSSHPSRIGPQQVLLGMGTLVTSEGPWRAIGMQARDRIVQVAQPLSVRERLAARSALQTIAPLLALLPVLGLLIWFIVGRELAPLARLAGRVRSQDVDTLAPLDAHGLPDEALPLVQALNELLERVRGSQEAQRAFVADAAHELRTPLTALRLQVQLARGAGDATEREQSLDELQAGVARATRTVEQLLALARAAPQAGPLVAEPVSLATLCREAVSEHAAIAQAGDIDLGLQAADEAAVIDGDADALRLLLANLVSNALRHTPAGGRVDLSCGCVPAGSGTAAEAAGSARGPCWLRVCDTGPGIAPAERERVFDRFYRGSGAPEGGSGLGLAIVRAVAERHRAQVSLDDAPGGGLCATVRFAPRASAA